MLQFKQSIEQYKKTDDRFAWLGAAVPDRA
jgi:hypothetical protein